MSFTWFRGRKALVAAVALLVLLAIAALLEDRYGPIDPTSQGRRARVVNDTGQAIHVKSSAEDLKIAAGQDDILVSPDGQLHVVYMITDGQNRILGCLTVDLDKRLDIAVNASSMRPCSGSIWLAPAPGLSALYD